jgi:hypothetical protein
LGSAARDAYEQSVRDTEITIGALPLPPVTKDEALYGFFDVADLRPRVEEGGDLHDLWVENAQHDMVPRDAAARDKLIAEQLKVIEQLPVDYKKSWIAQRFDQQRTAGTLVKQWKDGTGPPTPAARLVLAFADVALDFVGANPGILGIGGNGEKLISALSANFRKMLPDVDKKDGWTANPATGLFVERALTITLHAGLKTIGENPGLVVEEDKYRDLLHNVMQPLVTAFDKNPDERPHWIDVRDNLLGPMVEAALATLRGNPGAYFGAAFAPSTAVGAVTSALLGEATQGPLTDVFTPEGATRVYRALLDLAVQNPRLFVGSDGPKFDAARDLLAHVAKSMADTPAPFDASLGTNVAIAAIEALQSNVPALLRTKDDAWRNVAGDMTKSILDGLKAGLSKGGAQAAFDTLFTPGEAVQLLSIIMKQVAQTPGMVTGDGGGSEVEALVAMVASSATTRGAELLTTEDWLAVARAVAAEVARNPFRLIKAGQRPEEQLAGAVLQTILSAAAAGFPNGKRTGASLLFGQTLRQALMAAVDAAAGNAAKASANLQGLSDFVVLLNAAAAQNPMQIGASEWIRLFEAHVAAVLNAGLPAGMTQAALLSELEHR